MYCFDIGGGTFLQHSNVANSVHIETFLAFRLWCCKFSQLSVLYLCDHCIADDTLFVTLHNHLNHFQNGNVIQNSQGNLREDSSIARSLNQSLFLFLQKENSFFQPCTHWEQRVLTNEKLIWHCNAASHCDAAALAICHSLVQHFLYASIQREAVIDCKTKTESERICSHIHAGGQNVHRYKNCTKSGRVFVPFLCFQTHWTFKVNIKGALHHAPFRGNHFDGSRLHAKECVR